jgi:hypothetical protein
MKCQNDFFNFDFEVNYVTRKNKVLIKRWQYFLTIVYLMEIL